VTAAGRGGRGSILLYAGAFVLLLSSGLALAAAGKGMLEGMPQSGRLLWVSIGLSALAVASAVMSLFLPRRG
jgi:hypothetical protein